MNEGKCSEDINAVKKLEMIDPEMYSTLCIMHLSFVLDLSNEELEVILDSKNRNNDWRKTKRKDKENIIGAPLTQEGVCQIYQLIEYLGRDINICQEGLFRKTGNVLKQQRLKSLISTGAEIDLDSSDYSVHDCASVFKYFLSDMPEPLLTEAHFHAHCQIADMSKNDHLSNRCDEMYNRQLKAIQLLFLLLPPENKSLLKDLLMLLHYVSHAREDNCMDASSLAMLFAPHILCPRKMLPQALQEKLNSVVTAVTFMIENASKLFESPSELERDALSYINQQSNIKREIDNGINISDESKFVQTKITFCDRNKTTEEDSANYTKYAVADLYAYVQSMPESSQKKKLVKQFNNYSPVPHKQKKSIHKKLFGDKFKKHFIGNSCKRKEATSIIANTYTNLSDID